MRRWLAVLFVALLVQCLPQRAAAQRFLDRDFYLVDSLEKSKISNLDLKLIDSLLPRFHAARHDTLKTRIISDIIENCYDNKVWPRYNAYLKAFVEEKLRENITHKKVLRSHKRILSYCYNNLGYLLKQKGEIQKALENYKKAETILRQIKDENGLATHYNNVGYIYFDQGNIPLAIEYFHKSIELYKRSAPVYQDLKNNQDQIAIVYNNLGLLYSRQNDYERALNYYQKVLDIKQKTNEPVGLALAYNNMGSIYIRHNQILCKDKDAGCPQRIFDLGMKYLKHCIVYDIKIGNQLSISRTYHNIGRGFDMAGQTDSAIYYFEQSIAMKRQHNYPEGLCLSLTSLGGLQLKLGDLKNAKKNLTEAYAYAQKLGFPENIAMTSEVLSKLYEKESNYRAAFEHYKTFIRMRDSTINEKNTRAGVQRDMEYEYRKKQATDSTRNAQKAEVQEAKIIAQESMLKSERNGKIALYTGVISLLIVVLLVYYRFRSAQKQKNLIQEQKSLVEEKQREIIDSINYAQRLQNAILAKESEIKKVFPEFFLLYLPKDIVAGDFYFFDVTETHAFYAAADCTGHGVPGAMVSVICSNALSQSINEFRITDTGKILEKAREIILETFKKSGESVKDGMDISLIGVKLDDLKRFEDLKDSNDSKGSTLQMQWSGANNSLFVYSAQEQKAYEIKSDKQSVGYTENPQPFTTHTLALHKNDYVFMYTDGLHDQFGGEKGKKFKKVNMHNLLQQHANKTPAEIAKELKLGFDTWKGHHQQVDDVCVTGIRI